MPSGSMKKFLFRIVFLFFILALFRWSPLAHMHTHYWGGVERDAGLYVWLVEQSQRTFANQSLLDNWFETNAFYPYGKTLGWSDNYLLPTVLASGIEALGGSSAFAYNLVLFLSLMLLGLFQALLAERLGVSFVSSLIVGGLSIVMLPLLGYSGHPQVYHLWFVSAALLFCLQSRYLALGLLITLAFYTTPYYAVFLSLIGGMSVFVECLQRRMSLRRLLTVAGLLFAGCTPLLLALFPYLQVQSVFGARALYEPYFFALTLQSFIAHTDLSFWYPLSAELSHAEARFGIGYLSLAVALIGVLLYFSQPFQRIAVLLAALALIAQWFGALGGAQLLQYLSLVSCLFASLPGREGFARSFLLFALLGFLVFAQGPIGNIDRGEAVFGPYRLFFELYPGGDSIRAVGRFGLVVLAIMLLGVGFVLDRIRQPLFFFMIALLLFAEQWPNAFPHERLHEPSAVFRKLDQLSSSEDVALILPLTSRLDKNSRVVSWGDFAEKNVFAMLATSKFQGHIINGYSGQRTKVMKELPGKIRAFPDPKDKRWSRALTTFYGLRYIVVRTALIDSFDRSAWLTMIGESSQLQLLMEDEQGSLLLEFSPLSAPFPGQYLQFPARKTTLELPQEWQGGQFCEDMLTSERYQEESGMLVLSPAPQEVTPRRVLMGVCVDSL